VDVNLGSGNHPAPAPWVNVDQWAGVRPDFVAPASDLPFEDETVDNVYCGHLLEHLVFDDELPAALAEIHRVLVPGGSLCVVGPDYDRALSNPEWHPLLPSIVRGGERWPGDAHQWLSTGPTALKAVAGAFADAEDVEITSLSGWPVVDTVGWQFAILAHKEP
jgi:SAM-dependent methyltransferase